MKDEKRVTSIARRMNGYWIRRTFLVLLLSDTVLGIMIAAKWIAVQSTSFWWVLGGAELLLLLLQARVGKANARKLMKPLEVMAQRAEELSRATFDPEKQDMELIEAMAVIGEYSKTRSYLTYEDIIEGLIVRGVWRYTPNPSRKKTDDLQKKRVYFSRTYIAPMVEKGWLVLDPYARRRFIVTAKGQAVIDVYHGLD